jgi:creatinine amidohydrolase
MSFVVSIRLGEPASFEPLARRLAIAPDLVRMHRAEVGVTAPLADLIDELREGGVAAVSRNGVLGDPLRATANAGRNILTRLTIDLVAAVDEWWS